MLILINERYSLIVAVVGIFTYVLVVALSLRMQGKFGHYVASCSPLKAIRKWATSWLFLLDGPNTIQAAYDRAEGKPFEISTLDTRYVFVSSKNHIRELDTAPDAKLSLQAAAKQMLQPQYTMTNFNWSDKRGSEGMPLIRTLRSLLTNNIPQVLPNIQLSVSERFDRTYESHPSINGRKYISLYSMIIESVAYSNALAFFGVELAATTLFLQSAMKFIESTLLIAETIRFLPSFLAPTVGQFMASRSSAHQVIHNRLILVTEQRLQERAQKLVGHNVPDHKDCIQWVMETSPKQNPWSAERIVHELMALWFGSVHVLTTTICFAVHDLCNHTEYTEPLRKELESEDWQDAVRNNKRQSLPLLDSFLKESMRTTPVESMSSRRMALEQFNLSDGTQLEVGDWLCTAPRAMMRDPANYTQPLEFHGFRHVEADHVKKVTSASLHQHLAGCPSQLTQLSDWQVWGTGRMACPGRFYAAAVMKSVVGLLITKYDMELANPKHARWFSWRSFIYPLPWTKVILQSREDGILNNAL